MSKTPVRVRFAPSPTGYLHVGGARTALFNWLLARQSGGRFILRIEDTDRMRNVADALPKILEDLRWLGLQWDEGPEVGGDYGPYFQSERLDTYRMYIDRLLLQGDAYYALETPEQLEALREQARAQKRAFKYQRPDPLPTIDQGLKAKAEGVPAVVRFKMPETDITVPDRILGDVTLARGELEDFVILKTDGWPTYHFACVVDDALMEVTHVLRGQEHLMNTPKHIALQRTLGFSPPIYGHLPLIFNMDGTKMGKRDKEKALAMGLVPPEIDVHDFRCSGFVPEGLINFIALLGWSPGNDLEDLSTRDLIDLFRIESIGKTNAKFDREKLMAFNTRWCGSLSQDRLLAGLRDFLEVNDSPAKALDDPMLRNLLVANAGFRTFKDIIDKSGFLFTPDDQIVYQEQALRKVLEKADGQGFRMVERLIPILDGLRRWTKEELENTLQAVCESTGQKMGNVAQPIRVAVTGTTVSPPIYDTLALLGKDRALRRMKAVLAKEKKASG